MLIDEVIIKVRAGRGGDGCIAFNKNMMTLGPTGASGGRGGDVCFVGTSDIGALRKFRQQKEFAALDGRNGRSQFRDGERGRDLKTLVPVGTVIHNIDTGEVCEITQIDEGKIVAKGGAGGRGNFHFRSSTNTSPKIFEPGKSGEAFTLRLELKLIADVGLIGLPNAGKSSLLNALTKASAKVANYPFTTLEPNLGVWNELIIADIPGLIEGASEGKGLGIKFLRHIERTNILFHLISADSPDPVKDYKLVKKELLNYNPNLLKKREYVFLSKSDTISDVELKKKLIKTGRTIKSIIPLSVIDDALMEKVQNILDELVREKHHSLEAES